LAGQGGALDVETASGAVVIAIGDSWEPDQLP
jgi:hypothetical protein